MRGYGAPESPDWGWGDPTPTSWDSSGSDHGYGSPSESPTPLLLSAGEAGAEGGYLIELGGILPRELAPYRLQILDGSEAVPVGGCFGGVAGLGALLFPTERGGLLRAFTPPLSVGVYGLRLLWGPSFGLSVDIPNGLRILRSERLVETYHARSLWPSHWSAGARDFDLEGPRGEEAPQGGPLELILTAAGRRAAELSGSVSTITTSSTKGPALAVESSLFFPTSGRAWLGSAPVFYTRTGDQELTLTEPLLAPCREGEIITLRTEAPT
jgi:hypothetical protein